MVVDISRFGAIAQLGERLLCKQEVVGSIPSGSTNLEILSVCCQATKFVQAAKQAFSYILAGFAPMKLAAEFIFRESFNGCSKE